MLPSTATRKSASHANPKGEQKKIRQDLRAAMRHDDKIDRLGISKETCQYLGAGMYEHEKKSRSPINGCMAFQVRGCELQGEKIVPEILSHVGVKPGENGEFKEWAFYPGFEKDENLFNLDRLLTDERAFEQARADSFIILAQNPLDAANVIEGGCYNVISTFGPTLTETQVDLIAETLKTLDINKVMVWWERSEGAEQERALDMLCERGIKAGGMNWDVQYIDRQRGPRPIPETLGRVVDFSSEQVAFVVNKARQQAREFDAKTRKMEIER